MNSYLATATDGEGLLIKVRFVKNQAAPPVRYAADETVPAAAIREVDLQAKYHRSAAELAGALGLTQPKCVALRRHLGIDADPTCCHEFVFSSQRLKRFSDNTIKANVRLGVERLKTLDPILSKQVGSGGLKVVGAVYNLATGAVEMVD